MPDQSGVIRVSLTSQQPDDWTTVNTNRPVSSTPAATQEPNDWETINPPQQQAAATYTPGPGFSPDEIQQPQAPQEEPGLIDRFENQWYNKPLLNAENTGGYFDPSAIPKYLDDPSQDPSNQWRIPEAVPYIGGGSLRSLGAGMLEGAANMAAGFSTPLNLATMGTAGLYGKTLESAPQIARVASLATRALSAPVTAAGAGHIIRGAQRRDPNEMFTGAVTAAGGGMGMMTPAVPRPAAETPMPVRQTAAPINAPVPEGFDPRQQPVMQGIPAGGPEDVTGGMPVREPQAPPTTFTPDVQRDRMMDLTSTGEPKTAAGVAQSIARERRAAEGVSPTGVERRAPEPVSPELQFVDPNTGELKPASEAVPGDIPYTPAEEPPMPVRPAGRGRMLAPNIEPTEVAPPAPLTPGKGASFSDWVNNLIKSESGEFDPSAILPDWGEEQPSAIDSSGVPQWNLRDMDRLTSLDQIESYVRGYERGDRANTPESQAIIRYGRELINTLLTRGYGSFDHIHDISTTELERFVRDNSSRQNTNPTIINRQVNYAEGVLQERGYNAEPEEQIPYTPGRSIVEDVADIPAKGKSLEEVEAAKKKPALERLGKLIGEDRAAQLTSGEAEIKFNERPETRGKSKRLSNKEIKSWARWADDNIKEEIEPDSSKPGMTVNDKIQFFPDKFDIHYRNEQGDGVGLLTTNMNGTGISRLAVSSKLGLRRGKVAFEMLKEAFDRGVSEPSGDTSDLTKNLIDRVKRLIKDTKGEIDVDVLANKINQIIDSISNSKMGQKVGEFMRDESGTGDAEAAIAKLRSLFEKQQAGTITPDELNEAKTLAQDNKEVINTPSTRFSALSSSAQRAVTDMVAQGTNLVDALDAAEGRTPPTPPKQPKGVLPQYGPTRRPTQGPMMPGAPERFTSGVLQGAPPLEGGTNPVVKGANPRVYGPTRRPTLGPRRPPRGSPQGPKPALVTKAQLDPNVPVEVRKPDVAKPSRYGRVISELFGAPRSLQSVDLPGITSAAFRQSRPLAFTSEWFKAWGAAAKAFRGDEFLAQSKAKIQNSKYGQPQYQPIMDNYGRITKYKEMPSIEEKLGLATADMKAHREEAIASSLAEKIPLYGRYVKASNRAYTAFLNELRNSYFEKLADGAEASGRSVLTDEVLGKKLADFVNNATGRGSLKFIGGKLNAEGLAEELGMALYSPRALSARLSFMNPHSYMQADALVRKEYWKGLARLTASWGAFSGAASLLPGASVSVDPNNTDFGKVRIGNTRIDPGAGFQQLLVLLHREAPQINIGGANYGGGGTVPSTGPQRESDMSTFGSSKRSSLKPFGATQLSPTRWSLPGTYMANQMNPTAALIKDMLRATQKQPVDLSDRALQLVLPMFATDIADAAKEDEYVAAEFAPFISSTGGGVQTYEKGDFGKPKITPFINQVLGTKVPTVKIGGR